MIRDGVFLGEISLCGAFSTKTWVGDPVFVVSLQGESPSIDVYESAIQRHIQTNLHADNPHARILPHSESLVDLLVALVLQG